MDQAPDNTEARELAGNLLVAVVDGARQALGQRLIAAYALGSLAHGGFSAHVSDIDVGLEIKFDGDERLSLPRGGGDLFDALDRGH